MEGEAMSKEHKSSRGLTDAQLVAYVRNGMLFNDAPNDPWPIEWDIAGRLEELAAEV
jgi:hypothetical protein